MCFCKLYLMDILEFLFHHSAEMTKVIFLAGPTGVGKTRVAQALCHLINAEIISCDSVQIYRDLIVGSNKEYLTAKTSSGETVPMVQHLIDIVPWYSDYSVGDYYDACMACIKQVTKTGKIPLVVGGTGFYMNWLLRGKAKPPYIPEDCYQKVKEELKGQDWNHAFSLLRDVDPVYASTLSENDFYRLERAYAVYKHTGMPNSSFYYPNRTSKKGNIYLLLS
jgi:tRNA dimethylallyltransferase